MQNTMFRQLLPAAAPSMEPTAPAAIRPRKRSTKNTSVACQRCRQYKTKCNGTTPCSACVKKGREDCIYEAANSREALRQRNEFLKRELEQVRGVRTTLEHSGSPTSSASPSANDIGPASPDADACSRRTSQSARSASADTVRDGKSSNGDSCMPEKQMEHVMACLRDLVLTTTDMKTRDSLLVLLQNNSAHLPPDTSTTKLPEETTTFVPHQSGEYVAPSLDPGLYQQPLAGSPNHSLNGFSSMNPDLTETGFNTAASRAPPGSTTASFGPFPPPKAAVHFPDLAKETEEGPLEVVQGNIATPADRRAARANLNQPYDLPTPYSSMSFASGVRANGFPVDIQDIQIDNMSASSWNVDTLWMPIDAIPPGPAQWASRSFANIRTKARWLIGNNVPLHSVIGPTSLHTLLDERPRDPDDQMNVSDWAQAFMSQFPAINIPDRVACWAILYKVLRWQACQTPETFADVPAWCRPSPSETFMPHMPILICLAWPSLRRYFVEQASNVDWVQPVMGSISVSWPHGDNSVFKREADGSLVISDAFEAWLCDANNWSLSKETTKSIHCVEGRALLR